MRYYLDAQTGKAESDGTTPETAWRDIRQVNDHVAFKAGDTIFLRRGCIWNGVTLMPKGSGTKEASIVVDSYGKGDLPLINRQGRFDDTENGTEAMLLVNQSYWTIRNIALSNTNPDCPGYAEDPKIGKDDRSEFPRRSGLVIKVSWVEGEDCTAVRGIIIDGVTVKNVDGSNGDEGNCYKWAVKEDPKKSGVSGGCGIGCVCSDSPNGRYRAKAEDICIQNCRLYNCAGTNIYIGSSAWKYYDSYSDVIIRRNHVESDPDYANSPAGVYIVSAENALVEENQLYNLSNGIAFQVCHGGVSRNNCIRHMHGRMMLCSRLTHRQMYWDGTGIDIDSDCVGNFHLYNNFVCDCKEGSFSFFNFTKGPNTTILVENNVSLNSEHFFYHQIGQSGYQLTFYGNIVIRDKNSLYQQKNELFYTMHQQPEPQTYLFEKNIFYFPGTPMHLDKTAASQYRDNLYEGGMTDDLPAGVMKGYTGIFHNL